MARTPKAVLGKPTKTEGLIKKQITPIIIKGGSLDISSPTYKWEDDDGKEGNHVKIKNPGGIFEIQIKGVFIGDVVGDGTEDEPLEIALDKSQNSEIWLYYYRES